MRRVLAGVIVLGIAGLFAAYYWSGSGQRWHEGKGYRWTALPVPDSGKPGFVQMPDSKTGVHFSNELTEEEITGNRNLLNGSGVALGDVDGDGRVDIYFCRLHGSNVLYRNLGDWRFEDITEAAGVACPTQFSTGATFVDVDGDADLDLLVTAIGGPNGVFLNDGTGRFTNVTREAGLASKSGSTTMAFADVDSDGDVDLYLTNYKRFSVRDIYPPQARSFDRVVVKKDGKHQVTPSFQRHFTLLRSGDALVLAEYGEPDVLYLNDGTGRFTAVEVGGERFVDEDGRPSQDLKDWGLAARFQDFDGDGDADLYVCNDFWSPDRIWLNDGKGRFRAIPRLSVRSTSASSMAVDFSDIDRDGALDFFVVDMLSRHHDRRKRQMGAMKPTPLTIGEIDNRPQVMRNTMFLNRGDNTYAEIALFGGVEASEWSWSTLFMDVDLDGYEDILVTTGHLYDVQDSDTQDRISSTAVSSFEQYRRTILLYPRLETPNIAFRNRGDLTFEEVGQKWGFVESDISHGMAAGDLDGDGDLDLVINRYQKPAGVYRNDIPAPRVAVRLKGEAPNTQGIGAKVRLVGGPVDQVKEVTAGGLYLSGSEPLIVFAAGAGDEGLSLEVIWPNGKRSLVDGVRPNRLYEVDQSGAQPFHRQPEAQPAPVFEDVSDRIQHVHHEEGYDDFARQPLLPNRLSQLGPGVAWVDLDRDGDDDLVIASGRGGRLSAYANDGKGRFQPMKSAATNKRAPLDQTAVLGSPDSEGATRLVVGISNFEDGTERDPSAHVLGFNGGAVRLAGEIPGSASSTGPLALGDIDGDGDLDLFVGGRTVPGRYPEPASSRIFRNDQGTFTLDEQNSRLLHRLGLVTGAVFTDLDGDGDPELVTALEWGPVKVFENQGGLYRDVTEERGLAQFRGWWNGVTTGDFDGDGRLDIVATNWGRNSKYHYDEEHPLRIYYDDFDNNGTLDIVEAHFDPFMDKLVPERGLSCMSSAMPFVRSKLPTYAKYGSAGVDEILGSRLKEAAVVEANTLRHTVFLNRGERFEPRPLPDEAQFAPGFGVSVADYDGDGHEDLFLSQNFFAAQIETPRIDAGRGLWLKGDGSGQFTPVRGQFTGVKVYGEQRGCAVSDFDGDGRVDLVVTQNGAATKLYRNVSGRPGLRVRLSGPPANPAGIGASVRLVFADRLGPVREIHAGSGYWSQDSSVPVLGTPAPPTEIWVRWPGGQTTTAKLPAGAREVVVHADGKVRVSTESQS